jgi:hypothetical protein
VTRLVVQIARKTLAFGFLHFDHLTAKLMNGALVGVRPLAQQLMVETGRDLGGQRFERAEVFDLETFGTTGVRDTQHAAGTPGERYRHAQEAAGQVSAVAMSRTNLALVDEEWLAVEGDGTGNRLA